MPRVRPRLDRIEKAMWALGGGTCRLCYGDPLAAIHVMYEPDSKGPGLRKTGECYLVRGSEERITDDLRCRACGAEAVQLHLMTNVGVYQPEGRRVCAV